MLNPIVAMDDFVIDRIFQPVADWLAEKFAISCYAAAARLIEGACVLYAVQLLAQAELLAAGETSTFETSFIFGAVLWMIRQLWKTRGHFETLKDKYVRDLLLGKATLNILRPALRNYRMALLPLSMVVIIMDLMAPPVHSGNILNAAAWMALLCAHFMAACQPKPPGTQSRSRKWNLFNLAQEAI